MIVLIWMFIKIIQGCPFTFYEQGLLPEQYNFTTVSKQVHLNSNELSFSIGFWSLSQGIIDARTGFERYIIAIGQWVGNKNKELIRVKEKVWGNYSLINYYLYSQTKKKWQLTQYSIPFYDRQDIWAFTLLTFSNNFSSITIEMTGQLKSKIQLKILEQDNFYNFSIGCDACMYPQTESFQGRISQIIFFENYLYKNSSFEQISQYCKIPNEMTSPQLTKIIFGLMKFQNQEFLKMDVREYGRKYCLYGWAKFSNYIFSSQQILLRLSGNKDIFGEKVSGDDLLKLEYYIDPSFYKSKIVVKIDSFCDSTRNPLCSVYYPVGIEESNDEIYQYESLEFQFKSQIDDSFYEGIKSWHFFQYEYGRNVTKSIGMLFQMYFFNSIGHIYQSVTELYRGSFTNGMLYFLIGEKQRNFQFLQAFLYDLNFFHNYQQDQELLLKCHQSCLTCNGPLNNNCLSCADSLAYDQLSSMCKCKPGFVEGDDNLCIKFEEYFSTLSLYQHDDEIYSINFCLPGYFSIPISQTQSQCMECPQNNPNQVLCADCWINQKIWHLNPTCTSDFTKTNINSINNFIQIQRKILDYDIYLIDDDFNLILLLGYQGFCNESSQIYDCHKIRLQHSKQETFAFCKPNFIFMKNGCYQKYELCLNYNMQEFCSSCPENYYLHESNCIQCPLTCEKCLYDSDRKKVVCLKCQHQYGLLNNECMKCGQFCQICQESYRELYLESQDQNVKYLTCIKCIDDSEYYISYDKVNCHKNQIDDCKYVLQLTNDEFLYLAWFIDLVLDKSGIFTICALCKSSLIYNYDTKVCSNEIAFEYEDVFFDCIFGIIANGYGYCIQAKETQPNLASFYEFCNDYIDNCYTCFYNFNSFTCLDCQSGFYSNMLTGQCQVCPAELNCAICGQQQKSTKDFWKQEIRAFWIIFFSEDLNSYYSWEIEDYEIICKKCRDGYILIGDKCFIYNIPYCEEFIFNSGYIQCIKCKKQNNSQLTIINNQCIYCPENCLLCRQRSKDEISIINSQFNDQQYLSYTYFCMKGTDDQLYYDEFLGQYINCKNQRKCQNSFIIELNLICSEEQYQFQLNQISSEQEKKIFQQNNILSNDLFSGNSFSQFEKDSFYLEANQNFIKEIHINIRSQTEQICYLKQNSTLSQNFPNHIFSLQNIHLKLDFKKIIQFLLQDSISFSNFESIQIKNVEFYSYSTNTQQSILFKSYYFQRIILSYVSFIQSHSTNNKNIFSIQIEKIKLLELNNIVAFNISIININGFIQISPQDEIKTIHLQNIKILDCVFVNALFLKLNLIISDILLIENLFIMSSFQNASIINYLSKDSSQSSNNFNLQNDILLKNIYVQSSIIDSNGLFSFETLNQLRITNLTITNSTIRNSSLMRFSSKIFLNIFAIKNLKIQKSQIIINQNSSNVETLLFNSIFLIFESNQYDPQSHFILLTKHSTSQQIINISNINMTNNYGINQIEIYKNYEDSLLYIEANNIEISNLLLQKGFGITEIFIKEAQNFTLLNTIIRQEKEFKFSGLHQQFECFSFLTKQFSFMQAISIYSTKFTWIKNIKILDVQTINFPLISYSSADDKIFEQNETFIVEQAYIKNNFMIQTNILSTLSVIQIYSQQKSSIFINQCKFQENLLHSYQSNSLKKSSALINIDCQKCQFYLNNSQIIKNLVTNSSSSIIFIYSQLISIEQCTFNQNGIFNYEILLQYFFKDFNNEEVYLEQVEQVYPINSETGNGLLTAEIISIKNTFVSQSQGQTGGAFKLLGLNNCKIRLHQIFINETKTLFNSLIEQGGAFFIDGSQTETLSVEISYVNGSNILCQNEGGFIFLKAKNQKAEIILKSLNLKNIYSQSGSFIFLQFQQLTNQEQVAYFYDVIFQNSQQEFFNFLNQYQDISEFDQSKLIYNRTAIYIENYANLYFKDLYFSNLEEGFMYLYGFERGVLSNIKILNSVFQIYMIKITPLKFIKNFIELKDFIFRNITNSIYYYNFFCFTRPSLQQLNKFQCNQVNKAWPKFLTQYYSIDKIQYQNKNCLEQLLNNDQISESEGLIMINGLSEVSKIIIFNGQIDQIDCSICTFGIISYRYVQLKNTKLQKSSVQNLQIFNSKCGDKGCLNFEKQEQSNQTRILQDLKQFSFEKEIEILQYLCYNNTASQGTCLHIENTITFLNLSNLINNQALQFGGAIYIKGNSLFFLNNCEIKNNYAEIGGGLYFENMQLINYLKLKNFVHDNEAKIYGDNYKVGPEKLLIYLKKNIQLEERLLSQNETQKIVYVEGFNHSEILLPSGQKVSSYQFFYQFTSSYSNANYIFRLRAVQFDGSWSKNLNNSYCKIQSRKINTSSNSAESWFTNNYTNMKNISFDLETQEFNLDDLVFFFDSDEPKEIKLQLEFLCNIITVQQFGERFPFMLKYFHNDYRIRLNIKTYPCQFGEIKNQTDNSCQVCDYNNGFFSLKLNQRKCELKDDQTTISVKSAMLQLKPGYWRPYFDSTQISYCYNLPQNCLGGWMYGDKICRLGHIGGLCELCDLYNVRGDGSFAKTEEYQCGTCQDQTKNLLLLIITIFWTLTNLFISVQGNLKVSDTNSLLFLFSSYRFTNQINKSQTGVLMKMLTNYLQIMASLATFQLNFSLGFTNFLNVAGNPIQTTAYSQDCLLINLFNFEIQYNRTIWLLFLPFLYLTANLIIFHIGSRLKIFKFEISIISTSILHIYLYFQPNLIGNFMQLLSYREISEYKWVKANISARYDAYEHYQWMFAFALPLLFIFGVFIPLLLFYNLFKNKRLLQSISFTKIWGYLYHEYTSKAYYWEIIKVFQRQLIIIILNFFEEAIALKGTLIILVTLIYTKLILKKKPYQIKKINDLDISSTDACTISICLAIIIYLTKQSNFEQIQMILWFALGFINFKCLLKIFSILVKEHLRNFTSKFEATQIRIQFPFLKKIKWINQYLDRKNNQQIRTKYLYQRLKKIVLPLARNAIIYKDTTLKNLKSQTKIENESIMYVKRETKERENFNIIKEKL